MARDRRMTDNAAENGAGPFLFDVPELAAGESWVADLRNREYNGTKGGFRKFMPFDTSQVTNESTDVPLRVEYNGQYEQYVVANTQESFEKAGITEVRVTNAGSVALAKGDAHVELVREPFGADEAARRDAQTGVIGKVSRKLTGLTPADLTGGGR